MNRHMNRLLCCLLALILCGGTGAGQKESPQVDLILVEKAKRKLHLMRYWEPVQSFDISLGQSPVGHKQREGDSRTPEGFYEITYRNPDSKFFRSLRISYPDDLDRKAAAAKGYRPGNNIMIHGEPNSRSARRNLKPDWTDGCIALRNQDMEVVWELVKEGTPIIIDP